MDREKVITWLTEISLRPCDFATDDFDAYETEHLANEALEICEDAKVFNQQRNDAFAMLKEQDEEHKRLLSWLGKFCRHIDNGDKWLTDEENIAFFKEKMKQQFGWDTD